jgi:hypothetical protein
MRNKTYLAKLLLVLILIGCSTAQKRTGVQTYYVSADGNNKNNGLTEDKPFKTLRWAIRKAREGKIKTITVIGTLNDASEVQNDIASVFSIKDTGGMEITITGKPDAPEAERAVLSGLGVHKRVLSVEWKSNLRFEYIEISGGNTTVAGGGIAIMDQATVFLGDGVLVQNNRSESGGGGVAVRRTATFTVNGSALVTGNFAEEFPDVYRESGDTYEEFPDVYREPDDTYEESSDMYREPGDTYEEFPDMYLEE